MIKIVSVFIAQIIVLGSSISKAQGSMDFKSYMDLMRLEQFDLASKLETQGWKTYDDSDCRVAAVLNPSLDLKTVDGRIIADFYEDYSSNSCKHETPRSLLITFDVKEIYGSLLSQINEIDWIETKSWSLEKTMSKAFKGTDFNVTADILYNKTGPFNSYRIIIRNRSLMTDPDYLFRQVP